MAVAAYPMDPAYVAAYNAAYNQARELPGATNESIAAAGAAAGMAAIGREGQSAHDYYIRTPAGQDPEDYAPAKIQKKPPPQTPADIMDKYNSGGYGAVGSEAARREAINDLGLYFQNSGLSGAEAAVKAISTFDSSVKAGGGGGGGKQLGPDPLEGVRALPFPATPLTEEEKRRDQRRNQPLGNLFAAYLNEVSPIGTGAGPFRGYLAGQEGRLSDLYRLGQAAQDIPDVTNFKQYLGQRGGISRPGVGEFTGYARRGAEALTSGVSMEKNPFR